MLPAVTPRDLICAVCAVVAPCGWTLPVFIATLLPFALIDVSATPSGADPRPGRELERDAVIFPVTGVPAFSTVAPLTTTSCSTVPVKVLPLDLFLRSDSSSLWLSMFQPGLSLRLKKKLQCKHILQRYL